MPTCSSRAIYGEPLFDNGLSPTEEEWNAARRRGIPILVFTKKGVEMESRQEEFVRRVEEYTGGRSRSAFRGPSDLQPQVVRTLAELADRPEKLVWTPLQEPVDVAWIQEEERLRGSFSGGAVVECHLVAVDPDRRIQATELEALPKQLGRLGRDHGLFDPGEALDIGVDAESAWAVARADQRAPRRGVRVRRDGTATVWLELPSDGLGQIFDPEDVTGRVRALLLVGSEASGATSDRLAPALGVAPIQFLVEGRIDDLGRRNSAAVGSTRHEVVRVEPEESVHRRSLPAAAEEIAQELTARLTQRFRPARRW